LPAWSCPVRREAREPDVEALTSFINEVYLPVEGPFYGAPRITSDEVREKLAHGTFLLDLDEDGTIRGCVNVVITSDCGYFGLLAVATTAQGQGLGRSLAQAAEARCRAAGCTRLLIDVVSLRTPLFAFYESLGFTRCGQRPFDDEQLKEPAHFVIMGKDLR
jgi:GNAT superfamily N-acetyltransferase